MDTATLSTKGQLVIPSRIRQALHLRAGEKVALRVEGPTIVIERPAQTSAKLVEHRGRKVLVAPPGAPPMTAETVRAVLADFP